MSAVLCNGAGSLSVTTFPGMSCARWRLFGVIVEVVDDGLSTDITRGITRGVGHKPNLM
jgi:hypothetical protein